MSLLNRSRLLRSALKSSSTSTLIQRLTSNSRVVAAAYHPFSTSPPPTPTPTPTPTTTVTQPASLTFLKRHPYLRWTFWGCSSIVFSVIALTTAILAHDALTYREAHVENVPATPLALHPKPGGPKNLPIVSDSLEDEQDEESKGDCKKERLVIVGGGWAAVALLSNLDPHKYNVTIISPSNFYLFTPLLPSATVGTVEPRSLVEPLRKIISRVKGHYIQGAAVDVVMGSDLPPSKGGKERFVEVDVISGHEGVSEFSGQHEGPKSYSAGDGERKETKGKKVYVPYDRLIVAVGSVTNTHGVPGLENCFHLKTIKDAREIRSHILDNLEIASLPTTSPEERERLLSMVVCGGGPTGVETAAEIYDMLNEDVLTYYPKILRSNAKVSLIQSREHILNTYSEKISEYAEKKFGRDEVNIIVNARVKRVEKDKVVYTRKDENGKLSEFEVPSGFTLWSTGIAMSPFTRQLTQRLPNQSHLKAIQIDSHLRVKGSPLGSMYALGDASTIDTRLIDYLYEFVEANDKDKDGKLNFMEFKSLANSVGRKFPLASKHFTKLNEVFDKHDLDKDGKLNLNEIAEMFLETQKKMTSLPATAQVASQQGSYLAKKLNKLAKKRDSGEDIYAHTAEEMCDIDDAHYKPFKYTNLGSLAYIGNAAAFDLPLPEPFGSFAGGLLAMYAWRSFYLSEQVSTRTRALLMADYIKRGIWGRDLSRL